jgi:hypothetical protein
MFINIIVFGWKRTDRLAASSHRKMMQSTAANSAAEPSN